MDFAEDDDEDEEDDGGDKFDEGDGDEEAKRPVVGSKAQDKILAMRSNDVTYEGVYKKLGEIVSTRGKRGGREK